MIKLTPLSCGLVSGMILGTSAYPLAAQAQFSPIQNANQSATIRGNNNTINQEINQTVIFRPRVFGSGTLKDSSFSRPKYKRKFKKGKRRFKQWKKAYGNEYKNWKRGWHRDDDDDDDYDDDD